MDKKRQAEDANRLKRLFDAHKDRTGESQEAFGKRTGIGNQSMVSQYLNNERPLNPEAAEKFALGMGRVMIDDFSPTIAKLIKKLNKSVGKVQPLPDEGPPPEGIVTVKEYRIAVGAGPGRESIEPDDAGVPAAYRASYFQSEGIDPAKAIRLRVDGNSMEPTIKNGSFILIDTGDTRIVDDEIYAIRFDNDLMVKRLTPQLDQSLLIKSDNADHSPITVKKDEVHERIGIIGRVCEWTTNNSSRKVRR